jgi:dTMP kinase
VDFHSATAWQRIHQTGRELDRIESLPQSFFEKVRQGYLEVARAEPSRVKIIDASATPEVVHENIWQLLAAQSHAV